MKRWKMKSRANRLLGDKINLLVDSAKEKGYSCNIIFEKIE